MRKIHRLDLDFAKDIRAQRKATFKEQDSITLQINIFDDSVPVNVEGQTPRLFIKKPDGTILYQTEVVSVDRNTITFDVHTQATTAPGICYAEIELIEPQEDGKDELITTKSFIYIVEPKVGSIKDALKSENHAYFLKEIEDFIKQAKIDIAEYKEMVKELLEEVDNANARLDQFNQDLTDADVSLKDAKDEALAEIDELKRKSLVDLTAKTAVSKQDITNLTKQSKIEIEELVLDSKSDIRVLGYELQRDIRILGDESINNMDEMLNSSLHLMEDTSKEALDKMDAKLEEVREEITNAEEIRSELEDLNDEANQTIDEMEETIENANTIKGELDTTIENATTTKEDLTELTEETKTTIEGIVQDALEEIENIGTGNIEGVNIAVEDAKKRLQEETVKNIWEVQQSAREEEERLASSLSSHTSELRKGLSDTGKNYLDRIEKAGEDMVSLVDGLEADITKGLEDIERTTSEGKAEIRELSNTYLDRIETEGQDIIDAVANLEAITEDHIKDINTVGINIRNSVNSIGDSKVNQISKAGREQIDLVKEAGTEKIDEINNILGVNKGEVEALLSQTREEINEHRATINTTVSEGINTIDNLKNTSLVEMAGAKDQLIEEIMGAELELKEDFQEMHTNITQSITNTGLDRMEALNNLIDRIRELEVEIEKNLTNSDKKAENLENTMQSVDDKIAEIRPVLEGLNELRALCQDLQRENAQASQNVETLNFLHTESDVRIVELRRLIELAKHYEEVVQRFIDARGGNHDEIEARLFALEEALTIVSSDYIKSTDYATEDKAGLVRAGDGFNVNPDNGKMSVSTVAIEDYDSIDNAYPVSKGTLDSVLSREIGKIDLTPYATKEELQDYSTKEELEATKEEVQAVLDNVPQQGYQGVIGATVRVASDTLGVYDDMPEAPEVSDLEYIGKFLYSTANTYRVIYLYNNPVKNHYPYIYISKNTNTNGESLSYIFKNASASTSNYNTARVFEKSGTGGTWASSTSLSSVNDYYNTKIYHHDMPIYMDANKTSIYRESCNSTFIGNVDTISVEGKYLVKLSPTNYNEIQGLPDITISKDINTTLHVYKAEDGMYQEIAIEGITYTRKTGGAWIGQDTSDFVKAKVLGNVIGSSIQFYNTVENIYASCPQPNSHKNPEIQLDFRDIKNDTYYRWFAYSKGSSAYIYNSSGTSKTVGILGYSSDYLEKYIYQNGSWSLMTGNSYNISCSSGVEIYKCTSDMYKGTSSTAYDKTIVIRKADSANAPRQLDDLNLADSFGYYNVSGENILNAPTEAHIEGVLEVLNINDNITQKLITSENIYIRTFAEQAWSKWNMIPNANDVSGMINKSLSDAGVDTGVVGIKGFFGEAFKLAPDEVIPTPLKNLTLKEEYVAQYGTPKHVMTYKYYSSSNNQFYKIWFFCDLNDASDGKYVSYDENYTIKFNNLVRGTDYVVANTTNSGTADIKPGSNSVSTISMSEYRSIIYHFDFNIFNTAGDKVLVANPAQAGLSNFDDASNGYYTIDLSNAEYSAITGAPVLNTKSETVKGYLEVVNDTQMCNVNGEVFTRNKGQLWKSATDNSVSKDAIMKIGKAEGVKAPEIFKSLPADLRYFNNYHKYYVVMFKKNDTTYAVIRVRSNSSSCKFGLNASRTSLYFGGDSAKECQYDEYNTTTGKWTTKDNYSTSISTQSVSCVEIYETNSPIYRYASNFTTEIMQDITVANFDVEETIVDFNEALTTGNYDVVINSDEDGIQNVPVSGELKGILTVSNVGDKIHQVLETTTGETYKRILNGVWSEWTTNSGGLDEETSNKLNNLLIPNNEKINTFTYTNGDGMPEVYNWLDLNGFKIMWVNVKLSEKEYNSGTTGLMMKTLNIPEEAQIFNQIIMANITSYCRASNNTLSRLVQNAEVISNISIRGRWRHTDGVSPNVDSFTIMCFGF